MDNEKIDIKKFKEEVGKLSSLLEANEQGCGSWWGLLDERMQNLYEIYYGHKPSALLSTSYDTLSQIKCGGYILS